jgi:thiamine-monophosphate kinase
MARAGTGPAILLGPGDDAAVLAAPDGRVVATTDVLVDGVHFDRSFSGPRDVGVRAAAANLADVAAMGAAPTALLVGLAAPPDLPVSWALHLTDGLQGEAARAGAALAGGDIVRSDRLTLAVTALGDLAGRRPVTRAGARPGDRVVLAGRIGFAAAGLAVLRAGAGAEPELAELVAAHRRPEVGYPVAIRLAELGATAMIDVSDGLAADVEHLARASGVVIDLDAAALPVPEVLRSAGRRLAADPFGWVTGGGDDHAFVATLPADVAPRARAAMAGEGLLVSIGSVRPVGEEGAGVRWRGRAPRPGATGHEHFRTAER